MVPRRHIQGRFDRIVLDTHRVVALEARPETVENLAGLLDRRLRNLDGTEAARQGFVFLHELLVLRVVAPMMWTSPRASTDLNMLAASDGAPSAEPAPIIVWTSSMNRIRFGRSLISRITFWMRSSNMPRSIVPATIAFI